MQKFMSYACGAVLVAMFAGCSGTAKMIAAKSQSERADVFSEVTDTGAKPQGYVDMVVKANIKTHVPGYYSGESETSLHGKPGYPFVLNIDGQAAVWKVDGHEDVKPAYDDQGNTSTDPEARKGIKYTLEKKLRLREGAHKVYLALPGDDYIVEAELALRSGEETVLEFKPIYRYKKIPTRIPTFLEGIHAYEVYVNGVKIK